MLYQNNGPYKIPVLGLGTFLNTDENVLTEVLHEALRLGYRHIDTAAAYQNEHIIGKVLKEWISSGKIKREDLFITTKLKPMDLYEDKVEEAMKTSLKKLQLDYVDLYLIHFPIAAKTVDGKFVPQPTDFLSVWKKMEEQVDAGITRTIGLSNFNISQIQRIQKIARIQPANLQIETHVFFQNRKLIEFARKHNITVVGYSPLGNPGRPNRIANWPNVFENEVVNRIARKHKKSTAQVAFKFLLQKDLVMIPKTSNIKRLKENMDVFDFKLDQEDIEALEGLERGEEARTAVQRFTPGIEEHPEYPHKKQVE